MPSDPTHALGPILITGCSSGIGRAIALHLAGDAETPGPVYASARQLESIEDLAEAGCRLIRLDVTDADARRQAIATLEAEHGAVGAIVNNAGYGEQGPLEETPLDTIRKQFETNLFGVIGLCQEVLPGMRKAGRGRIVNLSSMGGRLTFPGGGAYHASKFALEAMSDVLRFEVDGFGIKIVVIEPGPTATAFGRASIAALDSLATNPKTGDAYREFRNGIRSALDGTFAAPPPGATSADAVAEAVRRAIIDTAPEPRVVVGEMAQQMIELKESSTAREWDAIVGGIYPRPGKDSEAD